MHPGPMSPELKIRRPSPPTPRPTLASLRREPRSPSRLGEFVCASLAGGEVQGGSQGRYFTVKCLADISNFFNGLREASILLHLSSDSNL